MKKIKLTSLKAFCLSILICLVAIPVYSVSTAKSAERVTTASASMMAPHLIRCSGDSL